MNIVNWSKDTLAKPEKDIRISRWFDDDLASTLIVRYVGLSSFVGRAKPKSGQHLGQRQTTTDNDKRLLDDVRWENLPANNVLEQRTYLIKSWFTSLFSSLFNLPALHLTLSHLSFVRACALGEHCLYQSALPVVEFSAIFLLLTLSFAAYGRDCMRLSIICFWHSQRSAHPSTIGATVIHLTFVQQPGVPVPTTSSSASVLDFGFLEMSAIIRTSPLSFLQAKDIDCNKVMFAKMLFQFLAHWKLACGSLKKGMYCK